MPALWIVVVALGAAGAGCGGSSGQDATTSAARSSSPAPCRLGSSVIPHVPEAPDSWQQGSRPAVALVCSGDEVDPGAAIVGYPIPGGGVCVSAYSPSLGEAFGELCEPSGTRWTSQCERRGCVHYFSHRADSTVVTGPVPPGLEGIWIGVGGKPLVEGVMLATIHGRRMRQIGAREPLGFFAAYIPRCVDRGQLTVHMVAADSTQLGPTDKWDVSEPKCSTSEPGRLNR